LAVPTWPTPSRLAPPRRNRRSRLQAGGLAAAALGEDGGQEGPAGRTGRGRRRDHGPDSGDQPAAKVFPGSVGELGGAGDELAYGQRQTVGQPGQLE
jgi:hypothetical protein